MVLMVSVVGMLKSLDDVGYKQVAKSLNDELNSDGPLGDTCNDVMFTIVPNPGSAYPENHIDAWRNIAGYSGVTKLVERVAVN